MLNNNNPLYTEFNILPKELDKTLDEISSMGDDEWKVWALECRDHLIDLYQNHNTPFSGNSKSVDQIISDFKKLRDLDVQDENSKVYYQNSNGDSVLMGNNRFSAGITNWFPEILEVGRTVNDRYENSLWDGLSDEKWFLKNFERITRRELYNKQELPKVISQGLTNELRIKLAYPVTNFRAEVSKWIWFTHLKPFINDDELAVWDPSGGWAGRLVGFLAAASHKIFKGKKMVYIVTDPNPIVGERYEMLVSFWKEHIYTDLNVELVYHKLGSEMINSTDTFEKYKNKVSVVFTSPPYFYRERYVEDENQSFNKFNNYEHWRDYFLEPTLDNGYDLLRDDGYLLWNIADVDGYTLEIDTCDILEMLEMKPLKTHKMLMGTANVEKHLGVQIHNGNYKKYENVFSYQKQSQTTGVLVNNITYKKSLDLVA